MIKAQYTKRNHMLSIIDTNVSRTPTVSAKTGCVDIIFADDETAIAVRDAITAEHPFEPKEPPASAVESDYKARMRVEYRELSTRIEKLRTMLERHSAGKLDFKPTCPIELLWQQLVVVDEYASILLHRARLEHVDLDAQCRSIAEKKIYIVTANAADKDAYRDYTTLTLGDADYPFFSMRGKLAIQCGEFVSIMGVYGTLEQANHRMRELDKKGFDTVQVRECAVDEDCWSYVGGYEEWAVTTSITVKGGEDGNEKIHRTRHHQMARTRIHSGRNPPDTTALHHRRDNRHHPQPSHRKTALADGRI